MCWKKQVKASARSASSRAGWILVESWAEMYGSTAGPWGGVGGAAMTTFRMTMVRSRGLAILFAGDKLFGIAEYNPRTLDPRYKGNYHRTAAVWAV